MKPEAHDINAHPQTKVEPHGEAASDRAKLVAQLTGGPEFVKTGNGFDALEPSESLVSVIVPSYAHEEFVAEALQSVTGQTYRDVEVILIDDQSPDRTFE